MSKQSRKAIRSLDPIRFFEPGAGAPAALLAEVEVSITEGPLAGMKVTGIRVWRCKSEPDQEFVTLPGRQYETGEGEIRTYEYIRAMDGLGETVRAIRAQILAAYRQYRNVASPDK
jgi:hypothetical protein